MMAFNTNYKDTGLFGVYAVAKVSLLMVCFLMENVLKHTHTCNAFFYGSHENLRTRHKVSATAK